MNEYTIVLDKERVLKYSNRSFKELEKKTGVPILAMLHEIFASENQQEQMMRKFFSSEFITDFIWAGLLHEKVPYETAIDIIPVKKYPAITELAIKIIMTEFGFEEAAEQKKIQNQTPATQPV